MLPTRLRVLLATLAIVGSAAHVPAQTATWIQADVGGPPRLAGHAMAYDSQRGVVVMFGGVTFFSLGGSAVYSNETWEWNGLQWTRRFPAHSPSPRFSTIAFDSQRGVTVLFGGGTEFGGAQADTWEWDGVDWTSRASASAPSPRKEHQIAYDSRRGVTVLFGGAFESFNGQYGDTWEWDGTSWSQRATTGPLPRVAHRMAYDSNRGFTVLFGGSTNEVFETLYNDTWEWNGIVWVRRSVGPLAPRSQPAMAFDSSRGVTVLYGGWTDTSYFSDTWEWNGTRWTSRPVTGPGQRYLHAVAFDASRAQTVLYGGYLYFFNANAESWLYGVPCTSPSISAQPSDVRACTLANAQLSVTASGTVPLSYQWRSGTPRVNIPGANGPSLSLSMPQGSAAGQYDCVITNRCGTVITNPATLSVCVADMSNGLSPGVCDGAVTTDDLLAFLAYFEQGDVRADVDDGLFSGTRDAGITIDDLLYYLARFEAGC